MKKQALFILTFLFLISLVVAQPPFQQSSGDKSIQIESPVIETVKLNQDFTFHAHPHNSTDGKILPYSVIDYCTIHIYSPSDGEHITETNMSQNGNGFDWEYKVLGGNFTEVNKQYAIYIYCEVNSSIENRGGFLEYGFEVTRNGASLSQSEALIYIVLSFGILLLSIISFYFLIITPYKNTMNEKGTLILRINKLKYVKLGLVLITWGLFTWFLNIMIGLSENFASLTMYYGLFGGIFWIMNALSLPLAITILVIMFFEIIRDANIHKKIKKLGSAAL